MENRTGAVRLVPDALSIIRLLLAVPAFVLISEYMGTGDGLPLLVTVMATVVATDQLDGRIARRFDCCTALGAELDVTADVAFAVSGIAALAVAGSTPYILLAAMGLLLMVFALGSAGKGTVVYDPVGKTSGILCMAFPYIAVASMMLGLPEWFVFHSGCVLSAMVFLAFEFRMASTILSTGIRASG